MKINERFRKDVGDLDPLIKSIKEIGLIHPIVVDSNGVLIAGYRRLKACEALEIEPECRIVDFNNPMQAEIDENVVRKDFTPGEIFEINGYYNQSFSKQFTNHHDVVGRNPTNNQPRDVVAKITGRHQDTLSKINTIFNSGNEGIKKKVNDEMLSIDRAYKEVKKEKRKEEISQQTEEINNTEFRINGKYDVIIIDPPWNYGREYDPEGSRVANPYPEMDFEQLSNLEIPSEENCIIWLWTTQAFIWDAKKLMEFWGFDYKAILTWNKEKIGMGHWLRMQCEFCLLGIKGKPIWQMTDIRDIITEPRREHSRKPESFYNMVKRLPGKKIDYFSREQRDGFDSFGNDLNKFK